MNNVLDTSAERQPLTLHEAEDAILARWEDPDGQASEDETEAALDTDEETTGEPEFDEEDTYEEVDLEEETDPEEGEEPDDTETEDEVAEALADDTEVEIVVEGETQDRNQN